MPRPDRSSTGGNDQRAAKLDQLRKEARSADRRRTASLWVVAVAIVALVGGLVTWQIARDPAGGDLSAVKSYDNLGREHVTAGKADYPQTPAVGGDHHPAWWNCGIYTEEIPEYHAVHSLEHGAVWLTYEPGLPQADLEKLQKLASQEFMLLSPVKGQDSPIKATAWGKQLSVDSADDTRIADFIRTYRQGPQTPEPGAACTGGTTTDLAP
ncbi:DUF3105 domain-containing protein [Kribbia dieselivorans]|uniref:DUF3105 domain-containing protein n=1 Tax=Kribbia dieselivorans TaxID=331526 RepID=UPI000838AE54|nr:DUF3105 domain-containing protein [Kribbia dieselivorans]